jgi:tRNA A-37 threonylcarbamoyl transferase component Bud32
MSDPTAAGSPLDQIIADYLQAAEAGRVPSRQALLDAHPAFADELRAFFADYDRLDNRADALKLAAAPRPPAQRPKVRYLGDYELLEEIAEGGMGLVYKARQETLGRIVALKLVRAGRLARPVDVARFRIEAEAAAGLDHPNIVPLYEVGEHEGQHYLAMKFIDGPSLAKLPRGSVRAEVERLEAVARAVDFAHRQGILHRDIKPSNILTDSAGTPYVTDFGLAKRIDAELSLTESGQMLGTAGYIAPEQALGKKGLTVTADVFSLGAVLFERLTSTPAFPGGTILERLRSLHESITPRPTLLMLTLPRDLETVVLKCLEREPGKRYATAGALADDLARWLRGEPIVARRVTAMERFWLWCRRNPAVAGLTGATAVLLVAVTAVSVYSAAELSRRAVEAVKARDDAARAQQRAEGYLHQLATSFLRPIGYNPEKTDPAERSTLFELAELPEDRLKLLFVEVALADPDAALRVARRGEQVLQAVVGASDRRRQAVLALFTARQTDASADPRVKLAACRLAAELGANDLPAAREAFLGAIAKGAADDDAEAVAWAAAIADRLDGPTAARAWDALAGVLGKTTNQSVFQAAADALVAVAPRLDRAAAARAWDGLVGTSGKRISLVLSDGLGGLDSRSAVFGGLAAQMDLPAAARAWDGLIGRLGTSTDADELSTVFIGLSALGPRLDESAAVRAWEGLLGSFAKNKDPASAQAAGAGLAAVAGQLTAPAAARAWDGAAGQLVGPRDANVLGALGQGFQGLIPRLDGKAAARAADDLIGLAARTTDTVAVAVAARGLAAVAPALDGPAAARVSDALADLLLKAQDAQSAQTAGQAIAAVAPRLDPGAAARAWDGLLGTPATANDVAAIWGINAAMTALAARLDGPTAVHAVDTAIAVLRQPAGAPNQMSAALRLAALAPRLDPPAAARAGEVVVDVLTKTTDANLANAAVQALIALGPNLDPPTAGRGWDCWVKVLTQSEIQTGTVEGTMLGSAVQGLPALAPRLDARAVAPAADGLIRLLRPGENQPGRQALCQGLAALAARLDGPAAGRIFDHLAEVMAKTEDPDALSAVAVALAALGARLDGPAAGRAGGRLVGLIGKTTDNNQVQAAAKGLEALAERLNGPAAGRAFDALVIVIERGTDVTTSDAALAAALALADRADAADRRAARLRAARAAVVGLALVRDADRLTDSWDKYSFVLDQFGPVVERSFAVGHLSPATVVLADTTGGGILDSTPATTSYTVSPAVAAAATDLATIADCLRHPACVGDTRQMVLHRLEELAFPPSPAEASQQVAMTMVSGAVEPAAAGVVAAAAAAVQAKFERGPKFRATWDAVAWLKKHHPEIDLDKPYTPRK